jgi:two-component sensor histidine kinase
MQGRKRLSWRRWPVVAGVLSLLFISYGISLLSRTRSLQHRMAHEVSLLQELNGLNQDLNELFGAHRSDVGERNYLWADEFDRVGERLADMGTRYAGSPGMAEMLPMLEQILHHTDSLHRQAMMHQGGEETARATAILQILMQRATKVVDKAARTVHEEGLARHSATLSASWREARILLLTACLMAVVFAWLVGMSNRLLNESREHAGQLARAKKELEQMNKDLRETMLSKEEKEIMIKEIHHRVKNNLQIVKSLIRFQMDQVSDPKVVELFNECVNRVSAMALVHEQTYLSKDLANIDVSTYLSHLTRDLCQAYTIDTRLELDIRINVPKLGVDTLIPLGLLINEILSNSLKYAFKGRPSGTIFVHLNGGEGNLLHLRIGDDGVGLADRKRWQQPQSLGMELIHTLSDQLDARIDLEQGPGTVYVLEAHPQEKRRRA